MKNKELKKLSRRDLVEVIYQMKQREEELTAENERLKALLADRELKIDNAGSIANAAIEINKIFEVAQRTADDYLLSVKALKAEYERKLANTDE